MNGVRQKAPSEGYADIKVSRISHNENNESSTRDAFFYNVARHSVIILYDNYAFTIIRIINNYSTDWNFRSI